MFNIGEFKEVANKVPNYKSLPDEGKYNDIQKYMAVCVYKAELLLKSS